MPRKCVNHPDSFCNVCGELTFKFRRRNFIPLIKNCYQQYFGFCVSHQDKVWAPHICCITCVRLLTGWANGSRYMPFAVPMIWQEPKDHLECYFLEVDIPCEENDHDGRFEESTFSSKPHSLTQNDLNDLVRDLNLSKRQAELLGSRMRNWNLLHRDTKMLFQKSSR
ncbi:hypothetical protein X777_05359 [Ooceraea biroi]|uniref:Uncharacterized protein n=1 Tax=Ooceraea biroi TaxID=2015173 RepID=A0A026WJ49_OOCBI|nr:hypothetical protein X777_05359 [Ooceraea biroi]